MAGVKGRSGRKTRVDENTRDEIILKSWDIIRRFYEDPSIPMTRKAEIASRIASKNIPTTFDDKGLTVSFTLKDLNSDVKLRQEQNRIAGIAGTIVN